MSDTHEGWNIATGAFSIPAPAAGRRRQTLTEQLWTQAVIQIGLRYAAGEITADEMQQQMTALRRSEDDSDGTLAPECPLCGRALDQDEIDVCRSCADIERGEVVEDDCPY